MEFSSLAAGLRLKFLPVTRPKAFGGLTQRVCGRRRSTAECTSFGAVRATKAKSKRCAREARPESGHFIEYFIELSISF